MRGLIKFMLILFLLGVMASMLLGILVHSTEKSENVTMVQPAGTPENDLTYSQVNLNNAQANKANAEGSAAIILAESEATVNYSGVVITWVVLGLAIITVVWLSKKID